MDIAQLVAASGLLSQAEMTQTVLLGLPVMLLGLYSGNLIHVRMKPSQMIRVLGSLLILVGVMLLWRSC